MTQPLASITLHEGDLPEGLDLGQRVAVDTETMGLNQHRDRLCLVQLSAGDGHCHLVRFMERPIRAPRLVDLLEDRRVEKLFHYARFDLVALARGLGADVGPVFCTKIASKLARTYTDRHGLKDLCQEFLDIDLSKQMQSSDWGSADLSPAQLEYAAGDVVHLHVLADRLERMLRREGRFELAKACFAFLPTRVQLDLAGWTNVDVFAH
jgi:ribonuclease D